MAEVKIWPRGQNETGGILLMSRQELRQKKMQAACTECGLKIESRRNQP